MQRQVGFWQELWRSIRPDILAQYRDTAIMLNLLAIIALVQGAFFFLALLRVDSELLDILKFLHKWATVTTFGLFLFTLVLRSFAVAASAVSAFKRGGGSDT
jgi:hypothetical protein